MLKLWIVLSSLVDRVAEVQDRKDKGATAVEYGLMVSLIAVAIIGAVTLIGTNLTGIFNRVAAAL